MSTVGARAKRLVPIAAKDAIKRLLGRTPPRTDVRGIATTVDLYVWLVGGGMDTMIPIHNWYSVFFPKHATATRATLQLFDNQGTAITKTTVDVPPLATVTLFVGDLLKDHGITVDGSLRSGGVSWHLEPPQGVHEHVLAGDPRFVFWDRSYIGYRGSDDHVAWVHGVDKHEIVGVEGARQPWPLSPGPFTSSPEIPVQLAGCETFDVIVQNRDSRPRHPTLVVTDETGATIELHATVAARGVHRFEVTDACSTLDTSGLLRLQVDDLPTRYGRPIVLRRFAGGSFSLMHC